MAAIAVSLLTGCGAAAQDNQAETTEETTQDEAREPEAIKNGLETVDSGSAKEERNVELTAEVADNWDSYDTVLIGYPIWWGIAAWPVDGFVEANDFTGKTVIPFATSSTSGMGESGELLAEAAGTGEWQEGQRFRSGVSDEDMQAWVEELGLSQ